MEKNKEFHYKHSDIKGSPFLIDDCKNHYTYLNEKPCENDLDIILSGINNNDDDLTIIKKLPNVTSDNLYSILNGIKAIRNITPVNEELAFERYFTQLLTAYDFDFEKFLNQSKARYKKAVLTTDIILLKECVEMFVKWMKTRNYDIIDILLS